MTQPAKPSQPSAGALRAARNLRGRKWLARSRSDDEETAHVIDRETGMAELLEASKEVAGTRIGLGSALERLEQAIAKAEAK